MKIAEELIHDKSRALVSVPKNTSIRDALQLMANENVGCILVSDNEEIVGIWTERDLAQDVLEDGFDINTTEIGEYMSKPLISCEWDASVYSLMDTFLGLRIRHLLVKKEGEYIGLVSAGDVMKASIRAKDQDLARANAALGWQYYEEWKHK